MADFITEDEDPPGELKITLRLKRPTPDKDPPPPTGTSSAPPEGAHKIAEYRIVSLAPSVELTNNYPVPYGITALGNNDKNYSPNVRFRGTFAMRLNSSVENNTGDEPANGKKGIVSGARGGVADPITSSPIVKINGSPAIRDGDLFGMDKPAPGGPANTIGEGKLKRDTAAREAPKDERAWYKKGWDQFKEHSGTYKDAEGVLGKAGEWYNNPSQIGSDLRSAYDSLPSASDLWQGAQNLGGRAVDIGGQVIADPGGAATAVGGWARDQGAAAIEGGKNIYARDGIAGLAGAGLGIAGDLISPSRKLKAAEGVADLAKAARAEKKVAQLEKKAAEAGTPGLRVTEAPNPCAHLKAGSKDKKHRGGSYDGTRGSKTDGTESHHMPPKSSYPEGGLISKGEMPATRIDKPDHINTASHGSQGLDGIEYRAQMAELIKSGRYRDAVAADIKNLRNVAEASGDRKKYDRGIKEMLLYYKCLKSHGLTPE